MDRKGGMFRRIVFPTGEMAPDYQGVQTEESKEAIA